MDKVGYRGRPNIGLSLPWILLKGIVFQLSSANYDRASLNSETKPTLIWNLCPVLIEAIDYIFSFTKSHCILDSGLRPEHFNRLHNSTVKCHSFLILHLCLHSKSWHSIPNLLTVYKYFINILYMKKIAWCEIVIRLYLHLSIIEWLHKDDLFSNFKFFSYDIFSLRVRGS